MYLENSKCIHGNHSHEPLANNAHHHHHDSSEEESEHTHDFRSVDKKVLKIGFFITFGAMLVEIIAGVLTNSLALISDAIHMFTHAFALGLSLFAIIIATTKHSMQKTFGYHRIEILAAFINGLTIALSVVWIVYEAIVRLINPLSIDIKTMLIVAIFGLIVNILTGVILYRGDRENINVKSAFLHMLADTASSVVIIIGGVVIYFTNWYIVDTILALMVASVIARWAFGLLRESVNILLESSPLDVNEVKSFIENYDGVLDVHDIHITEITHKMYVLSAHLLISQEKIKSFDRLIKEINHELEHKFGIGHTTFQPEWKTLSLHVK
ncbi:MAG: cation diffusion facilitator family transporter [Campylobacteraceae bacterium]